MKRNILNLTNTEAMDFFIAEERYFTFDLPKYFTFDKLLIQLSNYLAGESLETVSKDKPSRFENVNYKLFNNKNGEYSWRLFQLINPVIYVLLVHQITEKKNWSLIVKELKKNTLIECMSIPVIKSNKQRTEKEEQIATWWEKVEQESISLALKYNYIFQTDIVDCYGSIYTHSIPWALHTKEVAKKHRTDSRLIGNIIDSHLREMSNGQTNGIPQGSILMDLIAEIVLKYTDIKLSDRLKKLSDKKFRIIRYRDDYRIFVNNPETGKNIIKELSNVLAKLGMRINSEKTKFSNDIISSSIKPDKLFWIANGSTDYNIEKNLLIIKTLSEQYRNSGTLVKELQNFYQRIYYHKSFNNVGALISIITDIGSKNPRAYPLVISILGKFISTLEDAEEKISYIESVEQKIKKLPNTEMVDLWLQRLTLKFDPDREYQGKLTEKVKDSSVEIWNSDWLMDDIKFLIDSISIIDEDEIDNMDNYPDLDEIALFNTKTNYYKV